MSRPRPHRFFSLHPAPAAGLVFLASAFAPAADCNRNGVDDVQDLAPHDLALPAPAVVPAGTLPSSIAAGDLDGDGRADLVAAVQPVLDGAGRLILFFNEGGGRFREAPAITVGSRPDAVLVVHFNGDGNLDVAALAGGGMVVLLGAGAGAFAPPASHATGEGPAALAAADLDGDADLDLAAADSATREVSLFFNRGDGTFAAAVRQPAGEGPAALAAADLDGDGDEDLAVAGAGGACCPDGETAITFLWNQGGGAFAAGDALRAGGIRATSMTAADLDGDGRADLAAAGTGPGGEAAGVIAVMWGPADGVFGSPALLPTGVEPVFVRAVDVDGDGRADLAAACAAEGLGLGAVSILRNGGARSFRPAVTYEAGLKPRSVAAADLDGDGDPDLAAVNGTVPGALHVLRNAGEGRFLAAVSRREREGISSIAAADVDADGRADLLVAGVNPEDGSGKVGVFKDGGGGALAPSFAVPAALEARIDFCCSNYSPFVLATADLNGDGRLDVAAAGATCEEPLDQLCITVLGTVSILLQEAEGLRAAGNFPVGAGPTAIAAGDIDGDRDIDLVTASAVTSSNNLSVLWNDGAARFARARHYTLPCCPETVLAADLDGDSTADVAAGNTDGGGGAPAVLVFFNDGAGGLLEPAVLPTARPPRVLAAADLDGDGDLDLATSGGALLRNRGGRRLEVEELAWTGGVSLAAADLDGDGDVELAAARGTEAGTVSVLVNRGDGNFTGPIEAPAGFAPAALVAADLDADGVADLAVSSPGTLEPVAEVNLGGVVFETEAYGGGSVSVLHNRTPPPASRDRNRNGVPDECERPFHRGDPNGDGVTNLTDAVAILNYLFLAGPAPSCLEAADAQNDGAINLTDPVFLLNFLFLDGPELAPPAAPPAACGADPDPEGSTGDLGCESYGRCG